MEACMVVGGTEGRRERLEGVLRDALLLGIELEPTYRVLSATVEPVPGRVRPAADGDPRLIVAAHPVSTLLAVLVERGVDGPPTVRTFEVAQLPAVVAALGTARLEGPVLGRAEPRPGQWAPQWSLQGRSSAADGTRETLTVRVDDGELRLDLFARCDVVELRRPDGSTVDDAALVRPPTPGRVGGGRGRVDGGGSAP
jgi:hypothetical protein